jgi:hypothetical protein
LSSIESQQQSDHHIEIEVPTDLYPDDPSAISESNLEHPRNPEPVERYQILERNPGVEQVPEDVGGRCAEGFVRRSACRSGR